MGKARRREGGRCFRCGALGCSDSAILPFEEPEEAPLEINRQTRLKGREGKKKDNIYAFKERYVRSLFSPFFLPHISSSFPFPTLFPFPEASWGDIARFPSVGTDVGSALCVMYSRKHKSFRPRKKKLRHLG